MVLHKLANQLLVLCCSDPFLRQLRRKELITLPLSDVPVRVRLNLLLSDIVHKKTEHSREHVSEQKARFIGGGGKTPQETEAKAHLPRLLLFFLQTDPTFYFSVPPNNTSHCES